LKRTIYATTLADIAERLPGWRGEAGVKRYGCNNIATYRIAVCRIAQYVERRVINPCVDGANPSTATNLLITTKTEVIMKEKFNEWMSRNNMMFSAMAGETFTNAEVVYTHIGLVAFIIIAGVAGSL